MSCEIQPARHNHQPTHQQGTKWASNGQKCQFRAKFGRFWAKSSFFTGEINSFVTHITEKPPRQLVWIVFGQALDQMGQKCPYLAKNASFLPNLALFCPFCPMPVGTWDTLGIKIPKPPYKSSLKMVGFVHFSNFLIPSEKYYKLQSCWITLYVRKGQREGRRYWGESARFDMRWVLIDPFGWLNIQMI